MSGQIVMELPAPILCVICLRPIVNPEIKSTQQAAYRKARRNGQEPAYTRPPRQYVNKTSVKPLPVGEHWCSECSEYVQVVTHDPITHDPVTQKHFERVEL